jgi:hypothetical protein
MAMSKALLAGSAGNIETNKENLPYGLRLWRICHSSKILPLCGFVG